MRKIKSSDCSCLITLKNEWDQWGTVEPSDRCQSCDSFLDNIFNG